MRQAKRSQYLYMHGIINIISVTFALARSINGRGNNFAALTAAADLQFRVSTLFLNFSLGKVR